jgi:hypothetical protein
LQRSLHVAGGQRCAGPLAEHLCPPVGIGDVLRSLGDEARKVGLADLEPDVGLPFSVEARLLCLEGEIHPGHELGAVGFKLFEPIGRLLV